MDEVAEDSDALMERYLEGEEISHEETVTALKNGVTTAGSSRSPAAWPRTTWPRTGCSTRSSRTSPRPQAGRARGGGVTLEPARTRSCRLRLQDARRPVRRPHQPLPRLPGRDEARLPPAQPARTPRSAWASCWCPQGKETGHADEFGPGDIGAVAKLKETHAGDVLAARDGDRDAVVQLPAPVMAFAIEPKAKGDEEKVFTALRRLQEEDPTIDFHRDAQTGEQIVAGLSQIHVEVIVDRLKSRFSAEVT